MIASTAGGPSPDRHRRYKARVRFWRNVNGEWMWKITRAYGVTVMVGAVASGDFEEAASAAFRHIQSFRKQIGMPQGASEIEWHVR